MPNAAVALSASGDTTVLTVASDMRFFIKKLVLVAKGAVDIQLKSGSTVITGVCAMAANQQFYWQREVNEEDPLFLGQALGDDFIINLSGSVVVGGWVVYDLKPQ